MGFSANNVTFKATFGEVYKVGGAVNSVNGKTGDVVIDIPAKLSDLYDDSVEHMVDKAYRCDIANQSGRAWNAQADFSGNVFEKHYASKSEIVTAIENIKTKIR